MPHYEEQLDSPPRSGSVPTFEAKQFRIQFQDSLPGEESATLIGAHFELDHAGRKLDAFKVATDAMVDWEKFLK